MEKAVGCVVERARMKGLDERDGWMVVCLMASDGAMMGVMGRRCVEGKKGGGGRKEGRDCPLCAGMIGLRK